MKKLINTVNIELLEVIKNVKSGRMNNQQAQTIINASNAVFKGVSCKIANKRFANKAK